MSWISRAYECRLCMDLPEANSTTVRDLYCLWAACLCLSWSAVVMRALTWVVFVPQAARWRCTLAVALHQRDSGLGISHARNYPRTFSLHKIFKCTHLKFTVYGHKQTDIHTHNFCKCSHASVGLTPVPPLINSTGGQGFMAIVNKPCPQATPSVLVYLLP